MMWSILVAGLFLSVCALRDAVRKAPVIEDRSARKPVKRIAWDNKPFSGEIRFRVLVPEDRGTVVVNEATIPRLERIL